MAEGQVRWCVCVADRRETEEYVIAWSPALAAESYAIAIVRRVLGGYFQLTFSAPFLEAGLVLEVSRAFPEGLRATPERHRVRLCLSWLVEKEEG